MEPERLLITIIGAAQAKKATDVHFTESKLGCIVKYRVNDLLIDNQLIERPDYRKLILLIKYRSHINLNNAFGPQSSAFDLTINEKTIRLRISTIITNGYENMVIRLNQSQLYYQFTELFHLPNQAKLLSDMLSSKNGLILITGPTGAGKTTLAYALLHELKKGGRSIVSIEDPVEHYEESFVQLQINEAAGITYDVSVKEILRHDPDLIFIGEIRDFESAKSAIRAALTGHLVISTLHAISALKALDRLLELGVTLIELEQVLMVITNQRLAVKSNEKGIIIEQLSNQSLNEAIIAYKHEKAYVYQTIEQLAKMHQIDVIKG